MRAGVRERLLMVHFYLILTILFWAIGQTLLKAGLSRTSPVDGFIACGVAGFAAGLPLFYLLRANPAFVPVFDPVFPYMAISVWAALCYLTFYYAIDAGELAVASALYGTCPIWTALFAVSFLGETLTVRQWSAIIAVVAGIMLLSYECARSGAQNDKKAAVSGRKWWMIVFIAVSAAAITGIADSVTKLVAINQSPATHLIYYWGGQIVIGIFIKAGLERSKFSISGIFDKYLLSGMFIMNLGAICFVTSMTTNQVSLVEAFTSSYIVLPAIASWLFFGERFTLVKAISVLVIVTGVTVLSLG